jgi:hypothetical protein
MLNGLIKPDKGSIMCAIALIGLLVAWIFYRLTMTFIIERMSA